MYFFDYSSGVRKTGWIESEDGWNYFNSDGKMQTGEIEYDGKKYNLDSNGQLQGSEDNGENSSDTEVTDDTETVTTKTERQQKIEKADKLIADFFETGSISSLGKLIVINWQLEIEPYTNYNKTVMIADGIDPELAEAGAEVITGELAGNLLGVTINGAKAFVNIRTGEIVYESSVVAGSGAGSIAGKNFKDHFLRHKGLLEDITGKKYPKYKTNGQEFLDDIGKVISDGTVKYEGMGTIKKGFAPDKIYRGNGVTIILKENNEFRTIIKSGEGMDLAIQMVE